MRSKVDESTVRARRAVFAECHKQGIDDATRHALIRNVGGVPSGSVAEVSASAAWRLLHHLRGTTADVPLYRPSHEWSWVDTVAKSRWPLLRKRIMLMKGIGKGSGPVEKPLAMCDEGELWLIVAALAKLVQRQGHDPNHV